jgi:hypothetical protein
VSFSVGADTPTDALSERARNEGLLLPAAWRPAARPVHQIGQGLLGRPRRSGCGSGLPRGSDASFASQQASTATSFWTTPALSEPQTRQGTQPACPAPSLPAAQVGARSELGAGGGEAPAPGAPSAQGLVEKASGSGDAPGAPGGQEPLKKAESLGGGDTGPDAGMLPPTEPAAPPKRGLWRALSSFTNKKGGGTQARPLPLP